MPLERSVYAQAVYCKSDSAMAKLGVCSDNISSLPCVPQRQSGRFPTADFRLTNSISLLLLVRHPFSECTRVLRLVVVLEELNTFLVERPPVLGEASDVDFSLVMNVGYESRLSLVRPAVMTMYPDYSTYCRNNHGFATESMSSYTSPSLVRCLTFARTIRPWSILGVNVRPSSFRPRASRY